MVMSQQKPVGRIQPRIGFVGLGNLGSPIVIRILDGGFHLTAWARREATQERFRSTTARFATNLEELGSVSDIVCLCVPDEPDVIEVLEGGLLEGMSEGGILVIHSTVRPVGCELFASMAQPYRVGVIDAPMCGGPNAAKIGALPIAAGGNRALFEKCLPLFASYAGVVRYCGALGSGQRLKLIHNLLYAANVEIIYDAVKVGVEWGLDRESLAELLTALPYKGFMGAALATGLAGPEGVRHGQRILRKDVNYVLEMLAQDGKSEGKIGSLARASLESMESHISQDPIRSG